MSDIHTTVLFTGSCDLKPVYSSDCAAGADLRAHLEKAIELEPGDRVLVPTGIRMAIPAGWEGQIRPRSGLAWKKGITLLNSPGTIDADYRGEVKIILINLGNESVLIEPGERIAQIIITQAAQATFEHCESLPASRRGIGGFGSTGR